MAIWEHLKQRKILEDDHVIEVANFRRFSNIFHCFSFFSETFEISKVPILKSYSKIRLILKGFEWGLWAGGQGARKMRISPGKGRTNLPLGARTAEIPK